MVLACLLYAINISKKQGGVILLIKGNGVGVGSVWADRQGLPITSEEKGS